MNHKREAAVAEWKKKKHKKKKKLDLWVDSNHVG